MIPLGPSAESTLARANELLADLKLGLLRSEFNSNEADPNFIEIVHALCNLIEDDRGTITSLAVESAYSLIARLRWGDGFDERADLLLRLAFLRWELSRKSGQYAEAREWRRRCAQHAVDQEHINAFMASSFRDRSAELNRRFLSDSGTAVAYWDSLDSERNSKPARVKYEASHFAAWLERHGEEAGLDEGLVHLLTAGALSAALVADNHLGEWDDWDERLAKARRHCVLAKNASDLIALLEHAEAVRLCQRCEPERAEEVARTLVPRFESLGYHDQALRVRFLLARTIKDQGRYNEAFELFEAVQQEAFDAGDLAMQAITLYMRAQVLGELEDFSAASCLLSMAMPIAKRSGWSWIEADIRATEGELRRDSGDLAGSVAAFTDAINRYESLGMQGFAAYVRVILAESLLLAARPGEAVRQITTALEVIDERSISSEAVAALGILREALRRQMGDAEALRRLRVELRHMNEGRL